MNMFKIKYCPGTLREGFSTYSPVCLKNVFNGKKVSHILPYQTPDNDEKTADAFLKNREHISISGVQKKISLIQEKNILRVTKEGEHGTHILKPIPADLKKASQVPANENLTMQIARQVYGISTAPNAMIFFEDGSPAYITKRFDIRKEGSKWSKEDFATLAAKTKDNSGPNFKYEYSYEKLGLLIQKYVPAWKVEIEKYFSLVVFNYVFSNGDGHLKNFSLLESSKGDFLLSPAYDLVNSHLHVNDTHFALNNGLFADDYKSYYYKLHGYPCKEDFIEFGKRIGVLKSRIEKILMPFLERQTLTITLINNSFLNMSCRKSYLLMYNTRRNHLIAS